MVRIRLTRMGRKKLPFYRIVAADAKARRDGKPISYLGNYDPITKKSVLKIEEIKLFISQGAQPSDTVSAILKREGVL